MGAGTVRRQRGAWGRWPEGPGPCGWAPRTPPGPSLFLAPPPRLRPSRSPVPPDAAQPATHARRSPAGRAVHAAGAPPRGRRSFAVRCPRMKRALRRGAACVATESGRWFLNRPPTPVTPEAQTRRRLPRLLPFWTPGARRPRVDGVGRPGSPLSGCRASRTAAPETPSPSQPAGTPRAPPALETRAAEVFRGC